MSNYYKINQYDTANGEGLRVTIFFSGCTLQCKGCFNKELWNFNVGKVFSKEVYENEIKPKVNEHISGLSVLGGDPFNCRNVLALRALIKWFKKDFPNKNVWVWTGYTFEEIVSEDYDLKLPISTHIGAYIKKEVLPYIDVLIDGNFVEEQKDLTLKWRGSSNQRVIDVQKSLKQEKIVLYCD